MGEITRYDPNWEESVSSMERHPSGDYVEYFDHKELVDYLTDKIDKLEKQIEAALDALNF